MNPILKTLFLLIPVALTAGNVSAQTTYKIGELNSYKAQPAFLEPYKKGWQLALEEVNAAGGINGKKLEVISRDDNATPGDAVRVAEELIAREKVNMLMGTFLSNIGLAVSDLAKQRKVPFLASEPLTDKIVWAQGNDYTFRLRPSTYMQVSMLVPEAAKSGKKRWALVYPNYEYGTSAVESFKKLLKKANPNVEFVADIATPLGKLDAGPVTQAIADAKPDAIFNVLFGTDLSKFVREGNNRHLFNGKEVVSLLSGEPEYLEPLREDSPTGWLVTGYPWYGVQTPEHKAFFLAYYSKYKENPKAGSVVGYASLKSAAAALKKSGNGSPTTLDSAKILAAFKGLNVDTPFGKITYRADHQSTMGAFVGRTALQSGRGVMTNYRYEDGAKHLPSEAEGMKLRPKQ
jgi:branched-chain amino acid transport system substrate-binding protein